MPLRQPCGRERVKQARSETPNPQRAVVCRSASAPLKNSSASQRRNTVQAPMSRRLRRLYTRIVSSEPPVASHSPRQSSRRPTTVAGVRLVPCDAEPCAGPGPRFPKGLSPGAPSFSAVEPAVVGADDDADAVERGRHVRRGRRL